MNYILAVFSLVFILSCNSKGQVQNTGLLQNVPLTSQNFYKFESQEAIYHGFSWTNQRVAKDGGKAFIESTVQGSHVKNKQANGKFRSNMVAGNGLYLAQDPFVSINFGTVLIALKLKPNSQSFFAHASDADYTLGQEKHFIPVLLSQNPIIHYFWRNGRAFVLRSSDPVDQVDVFDLASVESPSFSDLPLVANLNDSNLPDFVMKSGVWMRAFADISNESDYRQWKDGTILSDGEFRLLVSHQKFGNATFSNLEQVTQIEVANFKEKHFAKANAINRAVNLYRQKLNSQWAQTWAETSSLPMVRCKKMRAEASEEVPIYGYAFEDMDSPRVRTFSYFSGTVEAEIIKRSADVAFVRTNKNEEGFTYMDDWKCLE